MINISTVRSHFMDITVFNHLTITLLLNVALQRLLGPGWDYSSEVEEMQAEHAALQGVRSHSLLELLLSRSVRWQLLTVLVTFTTLQLCGINAVSQTAG